MNQNNILQHLYLVLSEKWLEIIIPYLLNPFNILPIVIQGLVQMHDLMKMIRDFLLRNEINFESITSNTNNLVCKFTKQLYQTIKTI